MKKYQCSLCSHVYDEVKGDPDSGLAPGTKWDDVPEEWYCPECGAGKEDYFEITE